MTASPKYTPYAKASSFVIGLSALDPKRWIEPDADLDAFLEEKDRLRRTEFLSIFGEVDGSTAVPVDMMRTLTPADADRAASRRFVCP